MTRKILFNKTIFSLYLVIGLILWNALINRNSAEALIGAQGRSNGILSYLVLALFALFIYFSTSTIQLKIKIIAYFLFFINVIEITFIILTYETLINSENNPKRWLIGTFGNPDPLSAYLVAMLYLNVGIVLKIKLSTFFKYAIILVSACNLLFALMSQTLQTYVYLLTGLIIYVSSKIRSQKMYYFALLNPVLFLIPLFVIYSSKDGSIIRRIEFIKIFFSSIRKEFVLFGNQNFTDVYYEQVSAQEINRRGILAYPDTSHNFFIDTYFANGFIVAAAMSVFFFISFRRYSKIANRNSIAGIFIIPCYVLFLSSLINPFEIGLLALTFLFVGICFNFESHTQKAQLRPGSTKLIFIIITSACLAVQSLVVLKESHFDLMAVSDTNLNKIIINYPVRVSDYVLYSRSLRENNRLEESRQVLEIAKTKWRANSVIKLESLRNSFQDRKLPEIILRDCRRLYSNCSNSILLKAQRQLRSQ